MHPIPVIVTKSVPDIPDDYGRFDGCYSVEIGPDVLPMHFWFPVGDETIESIALARAKAAAEGAFHALRAAGRNTISVTHSY